jgi:ABC-2 type transport system ATP-binding protein
MNNEPIVSLRNVTKRIGRTTIIDNLTFDVPQGEFLVFSVRMERGRQQRYA